MRSTESKYIYKVTYEHVYLESRATTTISYIVLSFKQLTDKQIMNRLKIKHNPKIHDYVTIEDLTADYVFVVMN